MGKAIQSTPARLRLRFFTASIAADNLMAEARAYAEGSSAHNTRRAYASDLRDFGASCVLRGERSYPAGSSTIALYVASLAKRVKIRTIRRRLAAISICHRRAGLESPSSRRLVRDVIFGIAREKGMAPRRVDSITIEIFELTLAGRFAGTSSRRGVIEQQY